MGHTTSGKTTEPTTTRTWDSLSYSERHGMRHFLDHDYELGRAARHIAGEDHDLALWLVDAGNAFADLAQVFPEDITAACWREWRTSGLTPQTAAKLALHLKPVARIVGEHLVCPVCEAADKIVERDSAVRFNPLHVSDGAIYGATSTAAFDHDSFVCQHCGIAVRLPHRVEWS